VTVHPRVATPTQHCNVITPLVPEPPVGAVVDRELPSATAFLTASAGSENPQSTSQPPERGVDVELVAEAMPSALWSSGRVEDQDDNEDDVEIGASHGFWLRLRARSVT
jgi:hypothetical protein